MTSRRTGAALAGAGTLLSLIGGALYVLPGPGLPFLATGVALLAVGLFVLVVTRRN
ncbi:hypothetical protein [Streptomyces griseoluteus]|uniref:hypothetical protein n=1 Tax=Streptomyces griseoluteus TaxID=29306 RepID=UPI0036AEAEC5